MEENMGEGAWRRSFWKEYMPRMDGPAGMNSKPEQEIGIVFTPT